ncbi:HAD family hydrolase [Nocardiopsis alba]|uniref:HAD family hydrolase n=1 Tax=Nocardiopsis alba TaxID=53437 RepID=UPI003400A741
MASHVYFDFFGTLVDYDPSIHPADYNAPYEFALRAGLPLSSERTDALWSRAWTELDDRAWETGRECSMLEIATRYRELLGSPRVEAGEIDRLIAEYLEVWTSDVRAADGALDCLADLAEDHRLAIVSNTHHIPLVPDLAKAFGMTDHVRDIITSVEVGWRKPDPRIYTHVLERHGITAAGAVFVGDNWTADVEGPRRAGLAAFYVGAPAEGRVPVSLAELPTLVRELG